MPTPNPAAPTPKGPSRRGPAPGPRPSPAPRPAPAPAAPAEEGEVLPTVAGLHISREGLTYWVVAGVLALLTLIFGWQTVKRFSFRSSFSTARLYYDTGRQGLVREAAENAVSWNRSHVAARELLAVSLVHARQFPAAETAYQEVLTLQSDRATAHCGLGVIKLRQADAESDARKSEALLREAESHFKEALGRDECVEAQIGLANVKLLSAVRSGEADRVARVRDDFLKIFKRVRESADAARRTTREGYIDLFVGIGRTHHQPDRYVPEAAAAYRAAGRYVPTSVHLQACQLYVEAAQVAATSYTPEQLQEADPFKRVNELSQRIASSKGLEGLSDAWLELALSYMAAAIRSKDLKTAEGIRGLVERRYPGALRQHLEEVIGKLQQLVEGQGEEGERRRIVSSAYDAVTRMLKHKEMEDPAKAGLRAALLNNQAMIEATQGSMYTGATAESWYKQARGNLVKALEEEKKAGLADGSYEVQRNLAIVSRRLNLPEASRHLEEAEKRAAERQEEWVRPDLEKVRVYVVAAPKKD